MNNENRIFDLDATRRLFTRAKIAKEQGISLASVFLEFSKEFGLSVGSIRNYYYANLNTFKLSPTIAKDFGVEFLVGTRQFKTFERGEAEKLVKEILVGRAKAESVRHIVERLAGGNKKDALRLQNKYRSLVFHQRPRTLRVIKELSAERVTFFHPYLNIICLNGVIPLENGSQEAKNKSLIESFESIVKVIRDGNQDKIEQLRGYLAQRLEGQKNKEN